MKNKKIIGLIIIAILIIIIFIIKNNYNFSKTGNNIINKSADEVKEYILNIESYEAIARITIKSNKNENIYLVKQKYNKDCNLYKQEILEPSSIAGTLFIYDGANLRIENTKLNLNKIYENYNYIESNELSIIAFVEDYKENEKSKLIEKDEKIILETGVKNSNKYITNKRLYIDKSQGKIEAMEINDITQNVRIYILYNEIEINKLPKEEVLAFSVKILEKDI